MAARPSGLLGAPVGIRFGDCPTANSEKMLHIYPLSPALLVIASAAVEQQGKYNRPPSDEQPPFGTLTLRSDPSEPNEDRGAGDAQFGRNDEEENEESHEEQGREEGTWSSGDGQYHSLRNLEFEANETQRRTSRKLPPGEVSVWEFPR